jgi:transposase-like protein
MSEEQVRGRGRRRSRAEAEQVVAEYEASGLSRQEFCLQHGLAVVTLDRYRKRRRQPEEASGSSQWVTVELSGGSGPGSALAVVLLSGRRIEVNRGFDAHTLEELVRVLEHV